jgi:alkylation response protein AidB-like acyl-CoA dehydrogenase
MTVSDGLSTEEQMVDERLDQLLSNFPPVSTAVGGFLEAQFNMGLAWVHFPLGHGGLGLSRRLTPRVSERLRAAGAPNMASSNPIGYGMAAPTILAHGRAEQKERYLRPLFACDDVWCQLFSEPGAGSDLASLGTRAVRDGDEWTINGQKVWTTLAHTSRYGLLLARSDPAAVKHKGITSFIIDMHAEGVEVRPLRQMTGDAEFNEVYLTDVRVPDSDRLGDLGEGWSVAITTLMNERVSIGSKIVPTGSGNIGVAVRLFQALPHTSPSFKDRLVKLWIEDEALRLTNIRAAQNSDAGTPGPEGSTTKLMFAELNKRILEFCIDVLGPEGMLYDSYEMRRPLDVGSASAIPQRLFLRMRANSIAGGTSEIMRNILGERVLGLPREPRADLTVPWSMVPRN